MRSAERAGLWCARPHDVQSSRRRLRGDTSNWRPQRAQCLFCALCARNYQTLRLSWRRCRRCRSTGAHHKSKLSALSLTRRRLQWHVLRVYMCVCRCCCSALSFARAPISCVCVCRAATQKASQLELPC